MGTLFENLCAGRLARVTPPGHASLRSVSESPSGDRANGWMGQTR